MRSFSALGIKSTRNNLHGDKIKIDRILNKKIIVHSYTVCSSKFSNGSGICVNMQIELDGEKRVVFIGSKNIQNILDQVPKEYFPFEATLVKNDHYELI